MNKFSEWIQNKDKKQCGVAEKLGVSTTTLHDILRKGKMPSLKIAYEIEKYTRGSVTLYDWIDQCNENDTTNKQNIATNTNKNKK